MGDGEGEKETLNLRWQNSASPGTGDTARCGGATPRSRPYSFRVDLTTYLDDDAVIARVRYLVPREHHVRVPVKLHANRVSQRVVFFLYDERPRVANLGVPGERQLPDAFGKHELLRA